MAIQSLAIRPQQCTTCIHKTTETSSSDPEEARRTGHTVPRRYAGSGEEGKRHLATVLELLVALGFIVNIEKSIFSPVQKLNFLGFCLNSLMMTISLPEDKLQSIKKAAKKWRN